MATIIGTWEMSKDGVIKIEKEMDTMSSSDMVVKAAVEVENNPEYTSIGYGGLPNGEGVVQLDGGFMNGKTLQSGSVGGVEDIASPVTLAYEISFDKFNSFLVGKGAFKRAMELGLEKKNMLTQKATDSFNDRLEKVTKEDLCPYDGHDTVCFTAIDNNNDIAVGTSTSGLFMKKDGRLGDSPIIGSGFYAKNGFGAAAATGLGEDIMKTVVSYEIVKQLKTGENPMDVAFRCVKEANDDLVSMYGKAGDISVVCVNANGEYGAATNTKSFPFVVKKDDEQIMLGEVNAEGELEINPLAI